MGSDFPRDPAYMWRSNRAVHFCTKGYDSFFYAYEETGDPRYAVAFLVEDGNSGSSTIGPRLAALYEKIFEYDGTLKKEAM